MSTRPLIQIGERRAAPPGPPAWPERLERLRESIGRLGSAVVAYSGGVDSSLVLRVAHEALGERCVGVIGRSDSYARHDLERALDQAAGFGARVEIVTTGELDDPDFRSNPADRCYHCKRELYRKLAAVARRVGAAAVLDGTIADDLGDWRPGLQAARERGVRSPLAELGFSKDDVRAAARHLGLASHDRPASPCLASRIPHGAEITREVLGQVERGEELLRTLGFVELRLRHHGETARIEVPLDQLSRLVEPGVRARVVRGLRAIGYRFVTLDLEGFRSGSLNPVAGARAAGLAGVRRPPPEKREPSPPRRG